MRYRIREFVALAAVGVLLGLGVLLALGADTTVTNFDPKLQQTNSIRLKDNTDTSFSYATWVTGDGTHFLPAGDAPARAVAVVPAFPGTFVAGTSTGAAQANSPTLPAVAAKINYCSGLTITGGGATAASAITCTLSDGTTTLNFMTEVPAGAGLQINPVVVRFDPPLPAAAVNTAWTLTVPSFGAGNTAASSNLWGYVR